MDIDMRLEAIEEALYHIGEAIDHVRGVSGCSDIIGLLEGGREKLTGERDRLDATAAEQEAREQAALRREYWREAI